jgi:hypothetical protein
MFFLFFFGGGGGGGGGGVDQGKPINYKSMHANCYGLEGTCFLLSVNIW